MEVVDVDDVRVGSEGGADFLRVQVGRGGFQEHSAGFAEQPDTRVDHQGGDDHGGDGVGPFEARGDDDDAGDQGADEGVQVGDDVAKARLDVQAAAARVGELVGHREIDDDSDQGDHDHRGAVDVEGRHEAED